MRRTTAPLISAIWMLSLCPQASCAAGPPQAGAKAQVRVCNFPPAGPPPPVGALKRTGWNRWAKRFLYAPTFRVEPVAAARSYSITVAAKRGRLQRKATSEKPEIPLAGVWAELPARMGYRCWIEAHGAGGKLLGRTGGFDFHKVAPFAPGRYRKAKCGYLDSGRRCAEHVMDQLAAWKTGEPGKGRGRYKLTQYQALFASCYVGVLSRYARLDPRPPRAEEALTIAERIGRYMIRTRTPADWAYPHMPVTHAGDPGRPWMQVHRACWMGRAWLELAEATGRKEFLDAAMKLADTLKATQRAEGTWPFRVEAKTGKVVTDYTSDQASAIRLLDALVRLHGRKDLAAVRDRAVKWMLAHPVRTNRWQNQWDDVTPNVPFRNLQHCDAVLLGLYLLDHATGETGYVRVAEKLLRYVEDQFVLWENSYNPLLVAPGVKEQYRCYVTIDFHAAHYARFCLAMHRATGERVYLQKARAMADTLTVVQHPSGFYPTWMRTSPPKKPGELGAVHYGNIWLNCTAYTGRTMMELGEYLRQEKARGAEKK